MSTELEAYATRPITPFGVERFGDWRLKVYGIAYQRERPQAPLLDAARQAARDHLPTPAVTSRRYGVGFLGAHEGREGNFVFVDWWGDETDLHHCVFYSSLDQPAALRRAEFGEPIACVWDVAVIAHERRAWLEHVLQRQDGPDPDGYLQDLLHERL